MSVSSLTSYFQTSKHAHVLQWNPLRDVHLNWFPLCDSTPTVALMADLSQRDRLIIWDVASNGPPTVPWCAICVRFTQETVDRLTRDVLT
jgi:hypothetical protein